MNLLFRYDEEELVEGFVVDIIEWVQVQQCLQIMNEELEWWVVECIYELEEFNCQLCQVCDVVEVVNYSKDKYFVVVSYDLL